jgi:hypothetical protein
MGTVDAMTVEAVAVVVEGRDGVTIGTIAMEVEKARANTTGDTTTAATINDLVAMIVDMMTVATTVTVTATITEAVAMIDAMTEGAMIDVMVDTVAIITTAGEVTTIDGTKTMAERVAGGAWAGEIHQAGATARQAVEACALWVWAEACPWDVGVVALSAEVLAARWIVRWA